MGLLTGVLNQEAGMEARLARLEAVEAIRRLKAHYFHCCDGKDPDGMAACFVSGAAAIDYGVLGKFSSGAALAHVFNSLGCHPQLLEMHHGANPDISVLDELHATGTWSLHYQQIDTVKQTLTQLGAVYHDAYQLEDGEWKISATRCVVTSSLVVSMAEGVMTVVHAGA